jgi:hypothetical protein
MLSPEEIEEQLQLLATHRRTLAIYLQQQAQLGQVYSPPSLIHGIDEARSQIQRIKDSLRTAGVDVPYDPDDEDSPPDLMLPRKGNAEVMILEPSRTLPRQKPIRWWVWVIGGGLMLAVITFIIVNREAPTTTVPTDTSGATVPVLTVHELESRLNAANILLSTGTAADTARVRSYFTGPTSAYHLLAVSCLEVVGPRRFKKPVHLDMIDKWYTWQVGEDQYVAADGHLHLEQLKTAIIQAHNEIHGDAATAFEQLVEP